jgi:hypothetical protein
MAETIMHEMFHLWGGQPQGAQGGAIDPAESAKEKAKRYAPK